MLLGRGSGLIRLISMYDGEKYFSEEYSLEEAHTLEKKVKCYIK